MPQISATITQLLLSQIDLCAESCSRTRSDMIAVLLQNAINERNRQKHKRKNRQISDHTSDARSRNPGG